MAKFLASALTQHFQRQTNRAFSWWVCRLYNHKRYDAVMKRLSSLSSYRRVVINDYQFLYLLIADSNDEFI